MKLTTETPTERVTQKYRDTLGLLAGMKGRRNASLLGLASLGIMAGLGDDRILAEVRAASGTPPLTDAEIMHALRTARRNTVPLTDKPDGQRWTPPQKPRPPLGNGAASFVHRMIAKGAGASFDTLRACSPFRTANRTPAEQAHWFFWALYGACDMVFVGTQTDKGEPWKNIIPAWTWKQRFFEGEPPPPLLIANPLTGREGETKEGSLSYRCGACVAAFRFALVEFDALPIAEQCAFWAGVIASGTLPLRSLVYSGGKSIHGLVEIGAADVDAWGKAIDKLLYAVANPTAPDAYRADRACRNPDRLTRLPGAIRPDKGTTQSLLWLASPQTASGCPTIAPPSERTEAPPEPADAPAAHPACGIEALAALPWQYTSLAYPR